MEILTINYSVENPVWNTLGLVFILLFTSALFGVLVSYTFEGFFEGFLDKGRFLFSSIALLCILAIVAIPSHIKNFNKVEIQAVIDDNTDFNEIYDNYKIEKKEGKIYTLSYIVDRKTFDIEKERRKNGCN